MPGREVETSTRAQLKAAGILLGQWGLAAAAVQIAKRLDRTDDVAKYAAGMRELRTTLDRLEDLRHRRPAGALPEKPAPAEPETPPDIVTQLSAYRDRPVS